MSETIRVRAADPDNRRVVLWEQSDDHPGGEAFVTRSREVEVGRTPDVQRLLSKGVLVEVRGTAVPEPGEGDTGSETDEVWPDGVTDEQRAALAEAGYDTLEKVQAATDEELDAVAGIGPATVARLREGQPETPDGDETPEA
jgi:hypothetical protein